MASETLSSPNLSRIRSTAVIALPKARYDKEEKINAFYDRLLAKVSALPSVTAAAVGVNVPFDDNEWDSSFHITGTPPYKHGQEPSAELNMISPDYFRVLGMPILRGRAFGPEDAFEKPGTVIIDESLAARYFPNQNPIGKRFACCEVGPKGRLDPVWHEVVGVVGDVRAWGLDQQIFPEFYMPIAQMPPSAWDWIGRTMDLVVRTRGGAAPVRELQGAVASVAPGVPIYRLSSMKQKISSTLER